MFKSLSMVLCLLGGSMLLGAQNLDIYWVDVEGGAATLIVAPNGESMLVDTGYRTPDNRDAKRIFAVTQLAGLHKLNSVLITHFHRDHIGGLAALAKMIPIDAYLDHGETVEMDRPESAGFYNDYVALSAGKRRILKAGDRIPLKGVDIQVVIAAGQAIANPLPGAGQANSSCADFVSHPADVDPDNNQSVGFLLQYGKFRFLDLGDLTWNYEQKLVCPRNLIGKADLFQTSHHGLDRSNSPQLVWAIQPTVVVMNNGPRKGGPVSVFEILRKSPGLQDIWQVHRALAIPAEVNTSDRMIANPEETAQCTGKLLKASVDSKGQYTIGNFRNDFSKTYQSR